MKTTDANLMFLEAQLEQYLHSHELNGTTPVVKKRGFRLPDKKNRSLNKNMKFIERQLEQYLHEHTLGGSGLACTVARSTGQVLYEPEFTTVYVEPFPSAYGSPIHGTDWYDDGYWRYKNGDASEIEVSSTDPQAGSTHLRFTLASGAGGSRVIAPIMERSDLCSTPPTSHAGDAQPFSARVVAGDSIAWSLWAQANEAYDYSLAVNQWTLDGSATETLATSSEVELTTSYQQLTLNTTATADGYIVAYGVFGGRSFGSSTNDRTVDIDTPSLTITGDDPQGTNLVVRKTGFRFPYNWEKPGAVELNSKWLETQLTEYLHSHEFVYMEAE